MLLRKSDGSLQQSDASKTWTGFGGTDDANSGRGSSAPHAFETKALCLKQFGVKSVQPV